MKKLMIASAAATMALGSFAAGLASSNIVGYMNSTNTLNKQYSPVGAMFMTVGNTEGTWKLGDIKPKDGTLVFKTEFLQEFNPTTGGIGAKYTYLDANTAKTKNPMRKWADPLQAVGWWVLDANLDTMTATGPGDAVRADDVSFKAGQGLYSNFNGKGVKLDFSGEVVCKEWQLDLKDKQFSAIINYLARPITLGEITPEEESLVFKTEFVQEFNPTTGGIGAKYTYLDANTAKTKNPMRKWADPLQAVGWWVLDANLDTMTATGPGDAVKADDIVIQPGAGFYSNFNSKSAKLNFPSSIPTAK